MLAFVFMAIPNPTSLVEFQNVRFGYGERLILDGDALSDLMAPLELGWKARVQAETALMGDLIPLLQKRAQAREISGLSAYEQ